MKAKLDENLPLQLAPRLRNLGHDVHTMHEENLVGCDDPNLWRAAQREGRILITQDLDFSDTRRFAPGTHHGLILIRLHSPSRFNRCIPTRTGGNMGGLLCCCDGTQASRASRSG